MKASPPSRHLSRTLHLVPNPVTFPKATLALSHISPQPRFTYAIFPSRSKSPPPHSLPRTPLSAYSQGAAHYSGRRGHFGRPPLPHQRPGGGSVHRRRRAVPCSCGRIPGRPPLEHCLRPPRLPPLFPAAGLGRRSQHHTRNPCRPRHDTGGGGAQGGAGTDAAPGAARTRRSSAAPVAAAPAPAGICPAAGLSRNRQTPAVQQSSTTARRAGRGSPPAGIWPVPPAGRGCRRYRREGSRSRLRYHRGDSRSRLRYRRGGNRSRRRWRRGGRRSGPRRRCGATSATRSPGCSGRAGAEQLLPLRIGGIRTCRPPHPALARFWRSCAGVRLPCFTTRLGRRWLGASPRCGRAGAGAPSPDCRGGDAQTHACHRTSPRHTARRSPCCIACCPLRSFYRPCTRCMYHHCTRHGRGGSGRCRRGPGRGFCLQASNRSTNRRGWPVLTKPSGVAAGGAGGGAGIFSLFFSFHVATHSAAYNCCV